MINEINRLLQIKATIYKFSIGNKNYCYTDARKDIIFQDEIYKKIVISNDPIEKQIGSAPESIKIYTHLNTEIAQKFLLNSPQCDYIIREVLVNSPDLNFTFISSGEIIGANTKKETVTLEGIDNSKLLKVQNLNYTFSAYCDHEIYNTETCTLNFDDFSFTTKILNISTNRIILTLEDLPSDVTYFYNGIARNKDNQNQMIVNINTSTKQIELLNKLDFNVKINDIIKIAPNCRGLYNICNSVFNNIENNTAFIKTRGNPFENSGLKK
jgi:hypothetical protein